MGGSSSRPVKKPTPEISSTDRAVLDLKNARDRLQRYRKKLEEDDAKLLARAKQAKDAGKKEQALGLLRLRKYKQAQASACEDQLLNVHQMVETISSKQNEAAVLSALASGKDTLKRMHEETTVEDVLNLMDAVSDEIAVEQEINEILQDVPTLSVDQEEAIEAELLALQESMNGEQVPALPTAPTTKLPTPQQQQQEELTPARTPEKRVAVPS